MLNRIAFLIAGWEIILNQPLSLSSSQAADAVTLFRRRAPLIHCMTNDVVQSLTANVLLAAGASPAMIVDASEAVQFSSLANALLINVGTLTCSRSEAMLAAVNAANEAGTCWTLDPVAVGVLNFRTEFCRQLITLRPSAIRGNASEIMALAGESGGGRGVDTLHASKSALSAAMRLATDSGAVVVVSGETDYVTDGAQVISVSGGSPLMTRVVGTGCALSALVAGFTSLPGDRLTHIASACALYSSAGERAAQLAAGPGSFIPEFLDALYALAAEECA